MYSMKCPEKYLSIGNFHEYYSGIKRAPYLTIFIGGNHEASNHNRELYYNDYLLFCIHTFHILGFLVDG